MKYFEVVLQQSLSACVRFSVCIFTSYILK